MRLRVIAPPLLIVVLCFAAYLPALSNGFIWDDDHYIQANANLQDLEGLKNIWLHPSSEPQYYPLTHTTLWIEYQLWGDRPFGYHLDNILLHAASAILLWRILLLLRIPGGGIAAMLFALHPVQVESVAWATERKNVLSGLFYMLSLWAYLRTNWGVKLIAVDQPARKDHWQWYILSLALFFCAILSKSTTSTLPAVILLLVWWGHGRITRRDIWPLLPMFAAAIAMGTLTSWMEKHVVGAVGPEFDLSWLDRITIAGRAFWFYLGKLLWPARLTFIYPRWEIAPLLHPMQLLWPAAAVGALLALSLSRHRIGRGPLAPMFFFVGTLFPALGFVNVFPMRYSFVADHFQYLAMLGPVVLFAALLHRYLGRVPRAAVATLLIAGFCVLDYRQSEIYRDRQSLWLDTLAKDPDSPMAHANYGDSLLGNGDFRGAETEYRRAMQLRHWPSDAFDVGRSYFLRGEFERAIRWFELALSQMPDSAEPILRRQRARPLMQIGNAYLSMSRAAAATRPTDPATVSRYQDQATDAYRRAIELDPENSPARTNLGRALFEQGHIEQAIEEYRRALAIDPYSIFALQDLGEALLAQQKLEEAIEQFRKILRIDSQNVNATAGIGAARAAQGRWDDAIAEFELAAGIDPGNVSVRNQLMQAFVHKAGGKGAAANSSTRRSQ